MNLKIFGDTTPIDWQALGVKMPFAPMHELAGKYETIYSHNTSILTTNLDNIDEHICRTFEIPTISSEQRDNLLIRINNRICNTMAALRDATSDTICINLGGGYTHAQKYPNTGYAYSLINDHIWAIDYQLEQNKKIGIIDLDFHFGGGTWDYYKDWANPYIVDLFHPKGVLHNHKHLVQPCMGMSKLETPNISEYKFDKILLNLGTDWLHSDPLFGKYGDMYDGDLLAVWTDTIHKIVNNKIPLAITMGGGYGSKGLNLYESLISWAQQL